MKTPAQTCGEMGPAHAYLGRFRKAKHLNRGHNSDPIQDLADLRAEGGLPSEQAHRRESRAYAESVRKEAEANARALPTLDNRIDVEAPASRDANTFSPLPGGRVRKTQPRSM